MAIAGTQSFERLGLGWRRSRVPAFLCWWGGELTALLPARLRGWVRRGPDVLWLGVQGGTATLRRARTGTVLASIATDLPEDVQRATLVDACRDVDPDDLRMLLVVPATQVLVRKLTLPAASANDPRKVAGFEIDRQTPFKPDQVYYDVHVTRAAAPAGQVVLELIVVPKAELDPLLERCATLGATPDAVDVQLGDGKLAGVDLLPPGRRPRRPDGRRRTNWILAAVCVLLAVLLLSQWLANRRAALAKMQDEVDAMRAQAAQSDQLRAQLEGAIAVSRFLVKRKAENPSALAVLDDLTRRLPDTAWLDSLTLDDSGSLDIRGEAAKAAALVQALGDSPLLQEPRLQGVIQPDPATGKERFELVARLRNAGANDAH